MEPVADCVLIVDDDDLVRSMLLFAMQYAKIDAIGAASGDEALAILTESKDRIRLAIIDILMPIMDGPKTLAMLRTISPDLPCIFISGESGKYSPNMLQELTNIPLIRKPFQLPNLIDTIRSYLRPSGPPLEMPPQADPPLDWPPTW
ncbi:response regulator [Tuwongella immobilis]|uniref:Response regulatory domain-containing protein n=1 Tax=Tuwongella immobilis TaxID=692036 RepID=A0A6C2YGT6_9BACT|nr:response regulator [Tuwongella immobilis]VIP00706.1 histidine kinase : Uncharacterized protein OS=Bartonella bacilliformis str. Heidi Mejia GN=X471_00195 PE=4 SV=1: Response_reg [Tuwongella immobilis]VTR96830.1 histidine kinase : Uncharacterized protein OS=Bartonella bacilliformis str. Heidi Mejia GN=X471_00195 PE=4 SV=1: Response_reg [Tuwongella immobilis]